MSARTASAFAVERYSSLTLESSPAPTTSSLAMPSEPREHRPREVDALHAVERRATLRAEQDAAAHLDVVAGDAERVEPPRQVEQPDQHEQDAEHREPRHQVEVVGDDEVDRIPAAELLDVDVHVDVFVEPGQEDEDQTIAQVRDHESRDDDEEQSAAEQRRQRMQAVPLAVAERRRRGRRMPRAEAAGRRSSPAARSPGRTSFTDRSGGSRRRRRACRAAARRSSCSRPGITTPVDAAAVTNLSWAMPNPRSSGPWVMSTSCMRP